MRNYCVFVVCLCSLLSSSVLSRVNTNRKTPHGDRSGIGTHASEEIGEVSACLFAICGAAFAACCPAFRSVSHLLYDDGMVLVAVTLQMFKLFFHGFSLSCR